MKKFALSTLLPALTLLHSVNAQLYVTDNSENQIETFTQPGTGTVLVPNPNSGLAPLAQPTGITIGPDGNIYVVGTGIGEIYRYDGATGAALPGPNNVPPPMTPPNAVFSTGLGMSGAQGITFGADGKIYTTWQGGSVNQYDPVTGQLLQTFTAPVQPGFSGPAFGGIAVGPDGALYIADYNSHMSEGPAGFGDDVVRLDPTTGTFTQFVPSNYLVADDLNHPQLLAPFAVTFHQGSLYIATDVSPAISGRVLRFSGGLLTTFVPSGSAGLFQPKGLAFGPDGNLYVSSYFHTPPSNPVDSFVGRYDGSSGAFIDYYGQATSTSDGFYGLAFAQGAQAVPEASTFAIGVLLSCFLLMQFNRSKRLRR